MKPVPTNGERVDEAADSTRPRWVVGVDGSAGSRGALAWAAQNASRINATVQLITAWDVPGAIPTPETSAVLSEVVEPTAYEQAALGFVERQVADASAMHDDVEGHAVRGRASSVLLEASHDADLLVLGRRGLGGFRRLLVGSTSTQCATHTPIPTVIVPESSADSAERVLPSDIVVGFDGSPNSIAALCWALTFAHRGVRVMVVSVWDTAPLAIGNEQFFFPEATDLAEERFEHLVAGVIADTPTEAVIERRFVVGRARGELQTAAADADLLVVGARGHGAIGAALIGSVSTWLLHHVEQPVVVVPEAAS